MFDGAKHSRKLLRPLQGWSGSSDFTRGDASLAPGYFIVAPLALSTAPLALMKRGAKVILPLLGSLRDTVVRRMRRRHELHCSKALVH